MRSGHTSYLSYESALAEFGSISQVPAVYIVATTGNSGQYQTPYGDIEFTHTSRSEVEISPDNTSRKVKRWAGEVARALEESQAMVVLLTPAAACSLDIKRNIEYALGAKNYSNRLIPVVTPDGRPHTGVRSPPLENQESANLRASRTPARACASAL